MADQDRNRPEGRPERGSGGRPGGFGRPNSGGRPGGRAGGARRDDRDAKPARPAWQERVANNPDQAYTKPKAPPIPDEITSFDLPTPLRVQLKTLTEENAEQVARHLAMVRILIDQDPVLALEHAKSAASRAGRIAFIRETLGVTAYTAGDFGLALRELLAHRRATGSQDQLPLIVDSERGLERPQRALDEGRSVDRNTLEPSVRVNLSIALSGARLDLGQNDLALAELEIRELDPARVFEYSVPLFWAYSDTLEILGRAEESKRWATLAERAERRRILRLPATKKPFPSSKKSRFHFAVTNSVSWMNRMKALRVVVLRSVRSVHVVRNHARNVARMTVHVVKNVARRAKLLNVSNSP